MNSSDDELAHAKRVAVAGGTARAKYWSLALDSARSFLGRGAAMTNPLSARAASDDGYRLWLRYEPVTDEARRHSYLALTHKIHFRTDDPVLEAAATELEHALEGLLDRQVCWGTDAHSASLRIGTRESLAESQPDGLKLWPAELGPESFAIARATQDGIEQLVVIGGDARGVLYGVFALLRQMQLQEPLEALAGVHTPRLRFRMLNHWDNLDRSVERGYAGASLWDWHKLPHYVSPRYTDYARANASVGINAVCLTNVNADALVLTQYYLEKVRALANVLRAYGISVFLTARFNAPSELDGLATSDPTHPEVAAWWQAKVAEVYRHVPDFGGFVVKANSEGQPGPQDYQQTQAAGANLLARALKPHGGIVIWRAFVYDDKAPEDRHKQAYNELVPLDGCFDDNACLQAKNGAIDFQPREPFHPLFGAMPRTPLFLEFQITQEYLGCATHLVYLAPLFKETLDADTFCGGPGSTVSRVIAGDLGPPRLTGMAGVSNIGDERNWCGHPFAAANWYAFARLAWNPNLHSEDIADEWLRMTFSTNSQFLRTARSIMLRSREAVVDYMTPLGLHHLMAESHHYGPGPWVTGLARADWTATYYHQADSQGIGFDRTPSGSDALSQYAPQVQAKYATAECCPLEYLLWFHHLGWQTPLSSGRTLWQELCHAYDRGVKTVRSMRDDWLGLSEFVDTGRFDHVRALLDVQLREAEWWRNACLLYFQSFSELPFPSEVEPPVGQLSDYMQHKDFYVPGI